MMPLILFLRRFPMASWRSSLLSRLQECARMCPRPARKKCPNVPDCAHATNTAKRTQRNIWEHRRALDFKTAKRTHRGQDDCKSSFGKELYRRIESLARSAAP